MVNQNLGFIVLCESKISQIKSTGAHDCNSSPVVVGMNRKMLHQGIIVGKLLRNIFDPKRRQSLYLTGVTGRTTVDIRLPVRFSLSSSGGSG